MLPKIVILFSCLYVVYAGVITGNDLKEHNELQEEINQLRCCDFRACEKNCRRHGFYGGACINGRCKCYIERSDTPPIRFHFPATELSNTVEDDDIVQSPENKASCVSSQCNQMCRSLGFGSGVCIRPNVCQCRVRAMQIVADYVESELNEENQNEVDESFVSRGSCVSSQCNEICRRLGFAGGDCIRPNACRCRRYGTQTTHDLEETSELKNKNQNESDASLESRGRCVSSLCNRFCRKWGFAGGVCIRPNVCQCRGRSIRTADGFVETSDEAIVRTDRSCKARECDRYCKRFGYPRGVCIGNYCQCRMHSAVETLFPSLSSALSQFESRDEANLLKSCDHRACEQNCRRIGYPGGVCVNGRCKCDVCSGFPSNVLSEPELNNEDNNDFGESPEVRASCENSQCNQACRNKGYAGGNCIGPNVCQCRRRAIRTAKNVFMETSAWDPKSATDCLEMASG